MSALLLLTERRAEGRGEVFNLVDDQPITAREAYAWLSMLLKKPMPPPGIPAAPRKRGESNKRVSNKKLRSSGRERTNFQISANDRGWIYRTRKNKSRRDCARAKLAKRKPSNATFGANTVTSHCRRSKPKRSIKSGMLMNARSKTARSISQPNQPGQTILIREGSQTLIFAACRKYAG